MNNYIPPVAYNVPTPPTPNVSLSQIPYTGFDFGPLGDSLYWLALVAFALSAAYLLLYYQGGVYAYLGTTLNKLGLKIDQIRGATLA